MTCICRGPARLCTRTTRSIFTASSNPGSPPRPDGSIEMKARIVSSAQGARWLIEGWRLFRAAPLGWLAAVFAYWLLMTLASLVPFAGIVLASGLVPAFSLGFMALARAASLGAPLELSQLFDGFRNGRKAMLILGALYFACLAAVLGATMLADGGALARWMAVGQQPGEETVQS